MNVSTHAQPSEGGRWQSCSHLRRDQAPLLLHEAHQLRANRPAVKRVHTPLCQLPVRLSELGLVQNVAEGGGGGVRPGARKMIASEFGDREAALRELDRRREDLGRGEGAAAS